MLALMAPNKRPGNGNAQTKPFRLTIVSLPGESQKPVASTLSIERE